MQRKCIGAVGTRKLNVQYWTSIQYKIMLILKKHKVVYNCTPEHCIKRITRLQTSRTHKCVCIVTHTQIHTYRLMRTYVYIHKCVYMYVHIPLYIICLCAWICHHTCMYIYHTCIRKDAYSACVYAHIYIYIYINWIQKMYIHTTNIWSEPTTKLTASIRQQWHMILESRN